MKKTIKNHYMNIVAAFYYLKIKIVNVKEFLKIIPN